SIFLDISNACEVLEIKSMDNFTVNEIHHVYKRMIEGSSTVREYKCSSMRAEMCVAFLKLIEVIYTGKGLKFFSTRAIEAHRKVVRYVNFNYHFFDGSIEISFPTNIFYQWGSGANFAMKLHGTEESLANAKEVKGYTKFDISRLSDKAKLTQRRNS
ncbi:hypothetical protein PMAYCL1PPCAC_00481, partial [Pristionchus mayeri]